MSEQELKEKVLSYYDSLFVGFEIYDPWVENEYYKMINKLTDRYEEKLKENNMVLKRTINEQN